MIFVAQLSMAGEMMLSIVLKLISKEVQDKVKILPSQDPEKSMAILLKIVEEETIPDWLGGANCHQFNVEEYYPSHLRFTEEESHEFLNTMPYHAK
jgi:hypothetical protein